MTESIKDDQAGSILKVSEYFRGFGHHQGGFSSTESKPDKNGVKTLLPEERYGASPVHLLSGATVTVPIQEDRALLWATWLPAPRAWGAVRTFL